MKARVPKELTPGQRRRTEEWAKSVALDELEHQGRVMLDIMIKIFLPDYARRFWLRRKAVASYPGAASWRFPSTAEAC